MNIQLKNNDIKRPENGFTFQWQVITVMNGKQVEPITLKQYVSKSGVVTYCLWLSDFSDYGVAMGKSNSHSDMHQEALEKCLERIGINGFRCDESKMIHENVLDLLDCLIKHFGYRGKRYLACVISKAHG